MDPKIILSFVSSSIEIVRNISNLELYKKKVSIKRHKKIIKSIGVVIGFSDDINGCVVYEFDKGLAVKLVDSIARDVYAKSVDQMSQEEFKEAFESSIGEIANMISGTCSTKLYQERLKVNITHPLVIINQPEILISHKQYVEAILDTIYGEMVISIVFDDLFDINYLEKETTLKK